MWYHAWNGSAVNISQPGFAKQLLDRFGMSEGDPVSTPYRSGCVVNCIPQDGKTPDEKPELIQSYQSLMGGLKWLNINTWTDISVALKFLSQFNCNLSQGHLEGGQYVLAYLHSTLNHGINFYESEKDS